MLQNFPTATNASKYMENQVHYQKKETVEVNAVEGKNTDCHLDIENGYSPVKL
jgi:hypothetical protein